MAWFFHAILCCFENGDFRRQFSSHSPMTIRSSRKRLRRASEKPGFSRASEKYATVQQKVTSIFSTWFAVRNSIKSSLGASAYDNGRFRFVNPQLPIERARGDSNPNLLIRGNKMTTCSLAFTKFQRKEKRSTFNAERRAENGPEEAN